MARCLRAAGRYTALVVTVVLLVPAFYIVFGGIRMVLGFRGKDYMQRRFYSAHGATYWEKCIGKEDIRKPY